MTDTIFINLNSEEKDDNVDFMILTKKEYKDAVKAHGDIETFLSWKGCWETWQELPITVNNITQIEELGKQMRLRIDEAI